MRSSFLPKCKPKITRILPYQTNKDRSTFFWWFFGELGSFFGYDPCLFGRAEILVIFGWHFGRNDDLIDSFWIQLTFSIFNKRYLTFIFAHCASLTSIELKNNNSLPMSVTLTMLETLPGWSLGHILHRDVSENPMEKNCTPWQFHFVK